MRADDKLANLGGLFLWKARYWIGNIIQLNEIGFMNIEVKYHVKSQSKKVILPINFIF